MIKEGDDFLPIVFQYEGINIHAFVAKFSGPKIAYCQDAYSPSTQVTRQCIMLINILRSFSFKLVATAQTCSVEPQVPSNALYVIPIMSSCGQQNRSAVVVSRVEG